MLSLRQVARSIPRFSSRFVSPVTMRRTFTALNRPTQLSMLWRTAPVCRATFATAAEQSGSIDHELSAKLESEIQLEAQEMQEDSVEELPAHLKDFLEQNPWDIVDTPGTEDVTLTRRFGKENIKVVFSIADITDFEPENEMWSEDQAMYDEETGSMQQGGAQSKGATSQGLGQDGNFNVASEGQQTPNANDEIVDEGASTSSPEEFPARLQITITKDGTQGALHIEATIRDGQIATENVHYFANADLAEARTAEKDWDRRNLYTGPPFANLDEDLQVLMDQYTAERGIDTALALWVPEYMDYKEQREYVNWLQTTKNFIDA